VHTMASREEQRDKQIVLTPRGQISRLGSKTGLRVCQPVQYKFLYSQRYGLYMSGKYVSIYVDSMFE
jgi:hypothetical protein